jgi:hypothetical protein
MSCLEFQWNHSLVIGEMHACKAIVPGKKAICFDPTASIQGSIISLSAIYGKEMNIIIIFGIIAIPIILMVVFVRRLNNNQWRRVQKIQGHEPEFERGLRNAIEVEANVISKNQTIVPNAGGFAKVDLQVVIRLPDEAPYQVTTCWLVEVDSLDLILPGRNVPIKVDPHKPQRIIPNVPWAKPWIFG